MEDLQGDIEILQKIIHHSRVIVRCADIIGTLGDSEVALLVELIGIIEENHKTLKDLGDGDGR